MLTPFAVLVGLAILLAIISLIWPQHPLLAVAVVLLGAAMYMGRS